MGVKLEGKSIRENNERGRPEEKKKGLEIPSHGIVPCCKAVTPLGKSSSRQQENVSEKKKARREKDFGNVGGKTDSGV